MVVAQPPVTCAESRPVEFRRGSSPGLGDREARAFMCPTGNPRFIRTWSSHQPRSSQHPRFFPAEPKWPPPLIETGRPYSRANRHAVGDGPSAQEHLENCAPGRRSIIALKLGATPPYPGSPAPKPGPLHEASPFRFAAVVLANMVPAKLATILCPPLFSVSASPRLPRRLPAFVPGQQAERRLMNLPQSLVPLLSSRLTPGGGIALKVAPWEADEVSPNCRF